MVTRLLSVIRRRWRALRAVAGARAATHARLSAGRMKRVLVVCYGNIYRSAFAGEYLRRELAGIAEIRSTGFHPRIGRSSPARHVAMSRELGVELSEHRSALTSRADVDWADTIVLMDRHNWNALDEIGADHSRFVWLGTLGNRGIEIPDPYELDDPRAREVLQDMRCACDALAAKVRG